MPGVFERAREAVKAAREKWAFGAAGGGSGARSTGLMQTDPQGRPLNVVTSPGMGQSINYAAKTGELWKNNSVYTAISWIRRNFPDARIAVQDIATEENDLSHPMAMLLARPNPSYSYSTLASGVALSWVADGNAYLLKRYRKYRQAAELYYRPHWMLRPVREANSDNYIDYYWYKPDSRTPAVKLPPNQVVHLRNGIDPEDELRGMSDLKRLLLSVYTEQECNRFIAAMLTNLGMPGAVLTFKPRLDNAGDEVATLGQAAADSVKAKYEEAFTGDRVGRAMVLEGDWNVDFPSVNIDASFIEKAKNISQADIAAAIGLPPVVLGFLVGLQHSTAKASHEDSRKQAYRECLMPMQRSIAEDLDIQLLPEFADNQKFRTVFDYRAVGTLSEDANLIAVRFSTMYKAGFCLRSEARKGTGLPVREGDVDDVFYTAPAGAAPAPGDEPPTDQTQNSGDATPADLNQ